MMSVQRLIDANALIEEIRELLYTENRPSMILNNFSQMCFNSAIELAEIKALEAPTIDAVPREEHELLVRRFKHLLESDYIRSFDEVKHGTGEHKRDIREADLENQRAHWIANCTCSRCLRGVRGYAIQSGYVFCPFCGADMREVHE